MNKILIILGLAAVTLTGVNAALVLNEDFNAYSNGNLVSQGGWAQTGSAVANPIQVNNGVITLAQGTSQDANRPFSAITSGSLYYSATVNFFAKNASADYFIHLGDGGASSFGARIYARSSGAGYQLGWGGSSTAPVNYGATLSFNTPVNIVFRYDIVAGTLNDTGKLYVSTGAFNANEALNPVYQDVSAWTGGNEVTSFAAIYFRQGTNTGNQTIDNIRVGTTFADVLPVPEPSTWALIFIGSVFIGGWTISRRFI